MRLSSVRTCCMIGRFTTAAEVWACLRSLGEGGYFAAGHNNRLHVGNILLVLSQPWCPPDKSSDLYHIEDPCHNTGLYPNPRTPNRKRTPQSPAIRCVAQQQQRKRVHEVK